MHKIGYIGNSHVIADIICCHAGLSLEWVIAERSRVTDDLLTFSVVRAVAMHAVSMGAEVASVLETKDGTAFVIMCDFGIILSDDIVSRRDIYNIHYGNLPEYKGRHPTFWATVNREKQIGISLHKVVRNIDAGDIVANRKIPYYFWMDDNSVQAQLTTHIPELLEKLGRYVEGEKDMASANAPGHYYPKVREDDYHIDLERDVPATIYNKVRAQAMYRGASCDVPDVGKLWIKRIRFCQAHEEEDQRDGALLVRYRDDIWIRILEYSRDDPGQ